MWELRMTVEIRKVDSQGRISLPAKWRANVLRKTEEVYILDRGDHLLVTPRRKGDLTKHFDAIEVDVEPEEFQDYNRLRKALLTQ